MEREEVTQIIKEAVAASNQATATQIESVVQRVVTDMIGPVVIPGPEHKADHEAINVLREPGAVEGVRYVGEIFGTLKDRRKHDKHHEWVEGVTSAWAGDIKTVRKVFVTGVAIWLAYIFRHTIGDALAALTQVADKLTPPRTR